MTRLRWCLKFAGWWVLYAVGLFVAWTTGVLLLAWTFAHPNVAAGVYLLVGIAGWLAWERTSR